MNRHFFYVCFLTAVAGITILSSCPASSAQTDPPRLPRKDSFFGVHFDFHARLEDDHIGQNTTLEMVDDLIEMTRPDYFQTDTKGHPGLSSYPTKVGNHSDSIVGDPLRIWREATARRGVALYAHHSGVWDDRAFALHPDWAARDAAGNPVPGKMSVVGPYSDRLLIPQIIELAKDYGVDGVWVDGECWGVVRDWSPAAQEAFLKETGLETVPNGPGDPNWFEWCHFQRELFRKYVQHYIREVKKEVPGFQICSNWAFSNHMPEAPFDGIDFISGDMSPTNSVNVCRYISRLFATQEIPWDLMAWSFTSWSLEMSDAPDSRKTAVQLMREAASVIAQGGGFQAVFTQTSAVRPVVRDGSVETEKVRLFGEVEQFCRARQEICFKAKPIPQIALLLSTEGSYRRWDAGNNGLFVGDNWQQDGIGKCLVADRQAVSVLVTQRLMEHMNEYPLIVAFQWNYLEPELIVKLGDYVAQGGKLYLVGPAMPELFKDVLARADNVQEKPAPEGRSLQYYTIGQGTIALTPEENPPAEFVNSTVRDLFPEPIVSIDGTPAVDLSLMRTVQGQMAVHLVNTSGPHETAYVIKNVDPVGPVTVRIRLATEPKKITQEPGGRAIDWKYNDGVVTVTIPEIPIHEILLVEE